MSELQTIKLPDVGDYGEVEVIEVLVAKGDSISEETSLITVESDKASMEIPSPIAGTITSMLIKTGDKVSAGIDLMVVDVATNAVASNPKATGTSSIDTATAVASAIPATTAADEHYDVVVLGAGPGGYTAAFRAADLGQKVLLIERYAALGGVCLNVGCIPSKALLHTAEIIQETRGMAEHGVTFGEPVIDINRLRSFKNSVIDKLTGGLGALARQRKVSVAHGTASFASSNTIHIEGDDARTVGFNHAIIATGSRSVRIPGLPYDDPCLMDSTGALALADVPKRLLVIGGGIIGLEMGCVYAGLGSRVTVVELSDGLMPGCDRDLVRPLERRLRKQFENIFIGSRVAGIVSQAAGGADDAGLEVSFDGGKAPANDRFDRVLLAVGRSPNGNSVNAEAAGVNVGDQGFIEVDAQQRTNVPHIFAIGDVVGQPMLAHKATHEGKVAAEVASGHKAFFDAKAIPSVAYTDPEVAWMGLTETQAREGGIAFEKAVFPWAASGRSLSMGRNEGMTKLLYDPDNRRLLGAGIVGPNAGELIAEAVLALELGADMEDIALTIHPHPTLSETLNFASEVATGTVTDLYLPKKKPA